MKVNKEEYRKFIIDILDQIELWHTTWIVGAKYNKDIAYINTILQRYRRWDFKLWLDKKYINIDSKIQHKVENHKIRKNTQSYKLKQCIIVKRDQEVLLKDYLKLCEFLRKDIVRLDLTIKKLSEEKKTYLSRQKK